MIKKNINAANRFQLISRSFIAQRYTMENHYKKIVLNILFFTKTNQIITVMVRLFAVLRPAQEYFTYMEVYRAFTAILKFC
jgi:hypothetical protein